MSICNAIVSPARALVGVDTECIFDGKILSVSKLFVLPHANVVLAGAGQIGFLVMAYNNLNGLLNSAMPDEFDGLAEAMPQAVSSAYAQFKACHHHCGDLDSVPNFEKQHCVLAGFSRSAGEMRCYRYHQELEAEGFSPHREDVGVSLHPWVEAAMGPVPSPRNAEDLGRIAREQTRYVAKEVPHLACGGRFIVARITQRGMTIEPVCELPLRNDAKAV